MIITRSDLQQYKILELNKTRNDKILEILLFFEYYMIRSARDGKTNLTYYLINEENILEEIINKLKEIYVDCNITNSIEEGYTFVDISWI